MLSVANAARPSARKLANEISTSGRLARQRATTWRSIAVQPRLLPPLIVEEDRAARDREIARGETVADLHLAVLLDADAHGSSLEQQRLALHPDGGDIALANHRLDRHRE